MIMLVSVSIVLPNLTNEIISISVIMHITVVPIHNMMTIYIYTTLIM